jgi:signal transduction histidine kinase
MFRGRRRVSISDPGIQRLDQPWQLSSLSIRASLQDREGNIWLATSTGLDRFRPEAVHMVPGLEGHELFTAVADDDGAVWVLSSDFVGPQALLWRVEKGQAVRQDNRLGFVAMTRGIDGIWFAGPAGLERRTRQGTTRIPLPEPRKGGRTRRVQKVVEDSQGLRIWLQGEGRYWYRGGRWEHEETGRLGAASRSTADAQGRVWDGFRDNLLRVHDGQRTGFLGPAHGVGVDVVSFIQTEPELLISGVGGFQMWHKGKFVTLRLEMSGETTHVTGLVRDRLGGRWLNTVAGLLHVREADWQRTMADPQQALRGKLYDQLDGYRGGAEHTRREHTAFWTPDGRLWLTSTLGVAWLDPNKLPANAAAPAADLLQLRIGKHAYRVGEISALAPGTQEFSIDYTAASYTMPERVSFRYRLHGRDADWHEVGTRREAVYSNLGPGTYRFEVVASNEDAVEGPPALSPPITIHPTFTQTAWFPVLLGAAAIILLTLAYRIRMYQLTRRFFERSMAPLDERERIARALHDGFLQSVHVLLLKIRGAAARLPAGEPARQMLDDVLKEGHLTIAAGREEIRALRRELSDGADMADALRDEAALAGTACEVRIEGSVTCLEGETAAEVFAIVREALRNALRHSGASRIQIVLKEEQGGTSVAVTDNGCGIASSAAMSGAAGHFGLKGMQERAARIGARLSIDSSSSGTTVSLYIKHSSRQKWRRLLGS